jgi:membrane protein required for colicin V production
MGLIDIILIVIVAAFVFFGLFFGLVHTIGSLVGAIAGIFLATRFIDPAFAKFGFLFGGGEVGKIILFIILFIVITRLVGIIFWLIEKVFGIITIIPFAKSLNRFLGAIFGFIEGVIVVGVVLFYAMQVLPNDTLLLALETSTVAKYLVATTSALEVLFPQALQGVMNK